MSSRELTPKKFFAPRSPFRQGRGRARPRGRAARRSTPCYSLYHVCKTLAAHLDLPCLQIRQPRLPSPCGATTPCLQPPPSLPSLARRQVGDTWTRRLCQQVSTLFIPLRGATVLKNHTPPKTVRVRKYHHHGYQHYQQRQPSQT